jgi:hypothetical protein
MYKKILVGEPEGKRSLVRPRHRWGNNTRMHVKEIGWEGVKWIRLAYDMDQ